MKLGALESRVVVATLLAVIAGWVALPACSTPRTPDTAALAGDGGDLTCDERLRAKQLCDSAMTHRCETQVNDCEASCDVQGNLPANSQKAPSSRSDMESTQCRTNCRQVREGCLRTVAHQCPAPCP